MSLFKSNSTTSLDCFCASLSTNSIISKVLEPYFTTKHKSQGTGLGLAIVDKIVRERHKASIEIYNEEFIYNGKKYKGLSFKIIFKTSES